MRAVRLLLALVSLAAGIGLMAVGVAGIQTFGSEGRLALESPVLESGNKSYSLVLDVAGVETGLPWSDQLGETTVGARSRDNSSLFVGLAATPDLDEYLSGVPYDVVRNEGAGWELSAVPGTQEPDSPRAEQFWTRRGTGAEPTIPFKKAAGGKTTFVVMNSDGGPGVAATMTVGYRSSVVFPLSVGTIVLGALLVLLAILLVIRSRGKRNKHEEPGHVQSSPAAPEPPSGPTIPSTSGVAAAGVIAGGNRATGPVMPSHESETPGTSSPGESVTGPGTAANDGNDSSHESGESGESGEDSDGATTAKHTEYVASDSQDDSRADSDKAKVDSESTDTGEYDSWFRDGKTK